MRKHLIIILVVFVFGVPYIAVAGDYDSGVKATLILKTTTTTGNYPAKYLNTERPEITAMKVEIKPGAETGWHSHPVPLYAYVQEEPDCGGKRREHIPFQCRRRYCRSR